MVYIWAIVRSFVSETNKGECDVHGVIVVDVIRKINEVFRVDVDIELGDHNQTMKRALYVTLGGDKERIEDVEKGLFTRCHVVRTKSVYGCFIDPNIRDYPNTLTGFPV